MGIYARIILRLKQQDKPTEAWLLEKSFALCSSIGAKHFMIQDGLKKAEFDVAIAEWHKRFEGHSLYPAYDKAEWPTWMELWEQIVAAVGPAPEQRRMAIDLTDCSGYGEPDDPPEYDDGKGYYQYGPDVVAEPGEWLLRVSVWSQYYGPGYERGDLLTLCAIAEWCEVNIPNCEVWYGGDSSGVLLAPFGNPERVMLRRHLYSAIGRDYYSYGSRSGITPPRCSLCPPGEGSPWQQFGSGSNYVACHCAGCGKSKETRDKGVTWVERKED